MPIEMINRDNIPQAASFRVTECGDPTCGPHLIALDKDDQPIVEIVIGKRALPSLIEFFTKKLEY
jgi:hypothetical protein